MSTFLRVILEKRWIGSWGILTVIVCWFLRLVLFFCVTLALYAHVFSITVFPIKSFHFSIFHKCSHISKTKGATDKRHTFLESASLSASICVVIKSSRDCHMEINIINYY